MPKTRAHEMPPLRPPRQTNIGPQHRKAPICLTASYVTLTHGVAMQDLRLLSVNAFALTRPRPLRICVCCGLCVDCATSAARCCNPEEVQSCSLRLPNVDAFAADPAPSLSKFACPSLCGLCVDCATSKAWCCNPEEVQSCSVRLPSVDAFASDGNADGTDALTATPLPLMSAR